MLNQSLKLFVDNTPMDSEILNQSIYTLNGLLNFNCMENRVDLYLFHTTI